MINDHKLEKITKYFRKKEDIIAVYLFGSTAKNKERKESDLDLAVLFKAERDPYERFQIKLQFTNELEEQINAKIDVVDLRSADLYFVHQIMKNKILLYERDTYARVSFEVQYRKYYFDHISTYKQYFRQSRKRLREREA